MWFHFSKSLTPASYYSKGILPTNEALELLKNDFYELAKVFFRKDEWYNIWERAIEELPEKDKCKFISNPPDFGPYGMLVKDAGLYPSGIGYFYDCPEIVEGVLRTIDKKKSTHIWQEFSKKGQPCVVTFVANCDWPIEMVTTPILYYILNKISGHKFFGMESAANYNGKNEAITPEKIFNVQTITFNDKKAILHQVER